MYHDYDMAKVLADIEAPGVKNFILDTDTACEVDDQFAIAYAMTAPDINLLALTAAPIEGSSLRCYDEMVKVRDLTDPEGRMNVPCYRGPEGYMKNIITPYRSEAAEAIVRHVRETEGIVYIAAIGAFTNVASALLIDPSIADKAVVILVGANTFEIGDCNECNLLQDKCAARVIFECRVPVVVLPAWGCTERLTTTTAELYYYLRGQTGGVGDYLCYLFDRDEGPALAEDGRAVSGERSIWDISSIALLRLGTEACNIRPVAARTVTADGFWTDINDGRQMLYADRFHRKNVMSDFFTTLRAFYGA